MRGTALDPFGRQTLLLAAPHLDQATVGVEAVDAPVPDVDRGDELPSARHEADRDAARQRAEGRLLVLGITFLCAFMLVGIKMSFLAASDPAEPPAAASGAQIVAARADITDRNGRILATNLTTNSLYAQPPQMVDPERAARELVRIFPDLDLDKLIRQFTGKRKFVWIKRRISPEQQQEVFDIGDPGLLFGPREMRLYPNGRLAAHVLGGAGFGREGVSSAEVIGVAGIEKALDDELRDPGRGDVPLALSLDLTVQAAVERVLEGGMRLMNAKGAAAVLMDIHTGEVISLASLPDFDPNDRPTPLVQGDPGENPLFNRAVQGVIGTARIAMMIGPERQQDFLSSLGLFKSTPVELVEAPGAHPLLPKKWSEIHTMTVSYGHGISASPLHLATAYSSLLNGGLQVTPTLLKREDYAPGQRVVSEDTSRQAREMLRQVVVHGTATLGEVKGYRVGGKTGTAAIGPRRRTTAATRAATLPCPALAVPDRQRDTRQLSCRRSR